MEKENGKVTEVLENEYTKQFYIHEMYSSGGTGYEPLTAESNITIFNASVTVDSGGNVVGAPMKEKSVSITRGEFEVLLASGQALTEIWADLMVPDEIVEA